MAIFKIIVTTKEDLERHYMIEADEVDQARAMAEQEVKAPYETYRNNVTIVSIVSEEK